MVWGLGGLLYLIGFFHRVAPAVITRELSLDFKGRVRAVYLFNFGLDGLKLLVPGPVQRCEFFLKFPAQILALSLLLFQKDRKRVV